MEPERLAVLPMAGVGWSDWGTPEAISRTLKSNRDVKRWLQVDPAAA